MSSDGKVCIAKFGAAHGVRGEIRLWPFTEDPLAVAGYGPLETKDGKQRFEIGATRAAKDHLVARIKGVDTRDAGKEYLNRLGKHMLLDADPTVIYALKLAGRWDGNIHKADLQIESPYNTYRFPGLPPGPIANPGVASLVAAAAPAKTAFLYFVARHDGSHAFATNIADHNHNVQVYQVQWYRDQQRSAAGSAAPK